MEVVTNHLPILHCLMEMDLIGTTNVAMSVREEGPTFDYRVQQQRS